MLQSGDLSFMSPLPYVNFLSTKVLQSTVRWCYYLAQYNAVHRSEIKPFQDGEKKPYKGQYDQQFSPDILLTFASTTILS